MLAMATTEMPDAPADDAALLAEVARGREAPFRALYRRHEPRVYRLAYSVLLDRDDADDVTQQVFVALHREAGRFRPEAALSTWLHRVTLNEALSLRRRLARVFKGPRVESGPSPERALALQRSVAFFRAASAKLAPLQRAVAALALDGGLEPKKIAPLVGLTPNATRVALHHALTHLRAAAKDAGLELPDEDRSLEAGGEETP